MNRWIFIWAQLSRKLWFRSGAYAVVSVFVAMAAVLASPWVPPAFAARFGGDSVEAVLTILASSMLAVTTFSLGAIVTAYTAVSQAATPRVAELVTGDDGTQKALSTFVGAFLYAIVGVTALNAGYYGPEGRAVIFLFSLIVVALVAFRLLSWVRRLSSLARTGHMIELVEARTQAAMNLRLKAPFFGGRWGTLPHGHTVVSVATGFVQNVDCDYLQKAADNMDCEIEILAGPGALVRRGEPLARLSSPPREDDLADVVRRAFSVGSERSFDQDPRFGLIVLGEIAGKALSPGVNDPGTAIQVISTGLRLMDDWSRGCEPGVRRPRLLGPPLVEADLLDDLFGPIMRYGAADAAVSLRLQKSLRSLAALGGPVGSAALGLAGEAYDRSIEAIASEADRARLKAAVTQRVSI